MIGFMLVWEFVLGKTKIGSTLGFIINPILRVYRRIRFGKEEKK
jgi:hypothetical protein